MMKEKGTFLLGILLFAVMGGCPIDGDNNTPKNSTKPKPETIQEDAGSSPIDPPPAPEDGGTVSPSVDSGVVSPGVDSGVVSPGVDSGVVSPGVDSGVVSPGVDSGIVSPGVDSGVVSPSVDSGVVSPNVDSGVVSPGIDSGVISPDPDAGNTQTPPASVTYYQDVAPILIQNCVTCHSLGGIRSQTPLDTYDNAAPMASTIKFYTENRLMPPWFSDNSGACGTYRDALWLSVEEINTLGSWADEGAPAGEITELPGPPQLPTLTEPTVTVQMGSSYLPSGGSGLEQDDYRCFVVDPQIQTEKFLTGFEVFPGNINVVHHVLLYRLTSENGDSAAAQKDASESGEGYTCFGGPGLPISYYELVGAWAPGGGAVNFPEKSGVRLGANRKMVMQVHYNLENGPESDQTSLKLKLQDTVDKEGYMRIVNDISLSLAPGQSNVSHTFSYGTYEWTEGIYKVNLWGMVPHMHKRGVSIKTEKIDTNGNSECINDIPYWDFNWQWFYFYDQSTPILPGEQMKITCNYNTSADTSHVSFGEGTNDEMCLLVIYGTRDPL